VLSVGVDAASNVVIAGEFYGAIDFGGGSLTAQGMGSGFVAKFDAAGVHQFSRAFGGMDAIIQRPRCAVTPSGDVVVVGQFTGTIDFGTGALSSTSAYDVFVARFDANGNVVYAKKFGSMLGEGDPNVAIGPDGSTLIAGSTFGQVDLSSFGAQPLPYAGGGDIFLLKLDAAGGLVWGKSYGDTLNQYPTGLAVDPIGHVVLTGMIRGTMSFGAGNITGSTGDDVFIAKLDESAQPIWARAVNASGDQNQIIVALDPSANVLLTGSFKDSMQFLSGPGMFSAGDLDIFVAKLAF
jgi:hypothetical protein